MNYEESSFVNKTDRPWPNKRLKISAIVGHTTSNSSKIWVRTGNLGDFSLICFPADDKKVFDLWKQHKRLEFDMNNLTQNSKYFHDFSVKDWKEDSTHVVDLSDLESDKKYIYALYSYGETKNRIILGQDREYSFKTSSNKEGEFRFGLFSCHKPFKGSSLFSKKVETENMEMWNYLSDKISGGNIDFLMAGGDQCYVDGIDELNIWTFLNKVMRVEGDEIFPKYDTILSWYRDIYRGYWGFDSIKHIFSSVPTYMIWDDHELGDGWGSFYFDGNSDEKEQELNEILPGYKDKGLNASQCKELIKRMGMAAKQVYQEYQHSHNPDTPENQYDYNFCHKGCNFYVLDGRGHRDINLSEYKILGKEQMGRFRRYVDNLDGSKKPLLFVVSAVPVFHMKASIAEKLESNIVGDIANIQDDLRDSWEWKGHDKERKEFMDILFDAAKRGIRVCILSGDVHISAAFKVSDEQKNVIYQLTSSAITYNTPSVLGYLLSATVPDEGKTDDGYEFERLALLTENSYSVIRVIPDREEVHFQLYGEQFHSLIDNSKLTGKDRKNKHNPNIVKEIPISKSIAKVSLKWK